MKTQKNKHRQLLQTLLFALSATLVLSGCSSAPSRAELDAADYGDPPSRQQYEGIVSSLFPWDAFSDYPGPAVKIEYGTPYRAWYRLSGLSLNGQQRTYYGYTIPVKVSKKSYNGFYKPYEDYKFFIRNGELVAYRSPGSDWYEVPPGQRHLYQPDPGLMPKQNMSPPTGAALGSD